MSRQCWAELAPLGRNRVGNETHVLFPVTPSPVSLLMIFVKEKEKGLCSLTQTIQIDVFLSNSLVRIAADAGCLYAWKRLPRSVSALAWLRMGALVGRWWLCGVTQWCSVTQ